MREFGKKIVYKLEENFLLMVIRHGLVMMIPFILTGGMACALYNFPVEAYQQFINGESFGWIGWLLNVVYQGTFGCFSVALVIALSMSFAMEKNEPTDKVVLYVIVAIAAYGTQLGIGTEHFNADIIGVTGCFLSIVVSVISCYLFYWLKSVKWLTMREHTSAMEIISANAVHSFLPAVIIILLFAMFSKILMVLFDVYSLQELVSNVFCTLFAEQGAGFLPGLCYTILLHILWLFGFHGSHILESVAQNNFSINQGEIFNKTMFDIYVVMGGCGTTICVLLALLLFFRKDRMAKLAKMACSTVVFNLNEVLNFGIPIVFNPVLAAPFILTPVMCFCVSYGATFFHLVPPVTHEISWTTPILFSGYVATGSIKGSIVQFICIILGVAIYLPFLRLNKRMQENIQKMRLQKLVQELQRLEESNEPPRLLQRTDQVGLISRMLLQDLKLSLEKKELFLLYQPQIDSNNVCLGAEALLRWKHPIFGFIYPPLIIYLAKEGDLLPKLEQNLLDMACNAIRTTQEQYDGNFKISINITAKSLLWDIETCIQNNLEKYQIVPEKLWIEITEQDMVANSNIVVDKLSRLRQVGHTLLIDDFGMGHTSLLYLQSNYFNVVKLDGSLIKKMLGSTTNQKIISSIVQLGAELGVEIIAEYVETNTQKEKLLELGCKRYQGYLFSKPVPLEAFISYLKEHSDKYEKIEK